MDITTKAGKFMAEIKSTSATTKAPNGSFEAVLSVPTLDRDKEVVDARAFEPLPDHITIDVDHAMTVEKTIGSGRPYYDGDVLKFDGSYASHPLAQMVRSLVDEGHIRTMSVAFMDAQYEIDDNDKRPHLRRAELLNAGIVGIPSNREALITASKSLAATVAEVTDAQPAPDTAGPDAPAAKSDVGDLGELLKAAIAVAIEDTLKSLAAPAAEPTATTPEPDAAAKAAASAPAAVDVARAHQHRILTLEADLTLLDQ
jgi:HK97 family phage prohead protease